MKGTVKFFNDMKNFGFIAGEDGKEYFVHITGLQEGVTIKEGDAVVFDVEEGDKGPKAANVTLDSGEASAPAEEAPAEEASEESAEEAPAEEAPAEEEKAE